MTLRHFAGYGRDLSDAQRAALAALVAPPYLAMSYPTPGEFGRAFGVAPGTPAYDAARAGQLRRVAASVAATYAVDDGVAALFVATRDGVAAVATLQTVYGTRPVPLADSIGAAASSLPTHRMLRGFCYPAATGLDPRATPEAALAEFGRLVVAAPAALRPLVREGALSAADAARVVRHGLGELVARSYWRDEARPAPPRAYLFNTTPRLARALRRRGLPVLPLFPAGAEPTPALLAAEHLGGVYFRRWAAELAAAVPPADLAGGVAPAIARLAARGGRAWERLPLSLPYLLPRDAALARAVARLAAAAGLAASLAAVAA